MEVNMDIVQVTVGKTFNTGNYTSLRLDLTANVDIDEDHRAVVKALNAEVDKMYKSLQGGK